MPTRNVVLTDRQESLINAFVRSGRYQNASEVLREGLRLVESRELDDAKKLEELRFATKVGLDSIERGEFREFTDAAAFSSYLAAIGRSDGSAT